MMHLELHRTSLFVIFSVLALSGCVAAAESDRGEAGGGGAGGGESVGVAQQAVTGCCCEVPVNGSPGKCRPVDDAAQCKYEEYTEGACSPPPEPTNGICSVSAVADGGRGAMENVQGFTLLIVLALSAAVRRRRPRIPRALREMTPLRVRR